jgi:hypothetical protein
LRSRPLSSILRRGNHYRTMLTFHDTHMFLAETAVATKASPCWHRSDAGQRNGNPQALAGRRAR